MIQVLTIRAQVYNIIKLRIANGTYPHGFRLQEIPLAKELNVSRSPVREALQQLVAEELLCSNANKGVYVREFSEKEVHEIFDFRLIIELSSIVFLEENPDRVPDHKLMAIRKNILRLTPGDIDYAIDDATNPHYPLVGAVGNEYISRRHIQASYCTMSFHPILFSGEMYDESNSSHLLLIEHLLNRDFSKARGALQSHLIASRDYICTAINKNS